MCVHRGPPARPAKEAYSKTAAKRLVERMLGKIMAESILRTYGTPGTGKTYGVKETADVCA